jgi:maltodextrin utilization protein YvdJ
VFGFSYSEGLMGAVHILEYLSLVKVMTVEVCGTVVFVVFVFVETKRAIRHIIELGNKDK